uniref:Zona pellucida sperm-binding protein 2 n=1 Tax=Ciona intestinalis TaxID=7719 RepID=F6R3R2_CIOIN|nr:alpha-tectorin isoform X1 [Ciona intestinalis]|eukprot:XP_002125134.1 alpha-tectorin isoform X1 [Ciona intestinalis]
MMIRILLLVFGLVEVSLAQVDYATLDCNDTVTIVVNATKLNLNASNLVITKSLSESESTWCRPLMRGGIDPNAVEFQIRPVNGCLPVIKETTVYINYTWTVWVYNGGLAPAKGAPPILRYKSFCLKFSCCFANKYNLTAPYVIPMIEKVTRPTIMKQGKFQFKLGYFDQAYGGQLKNPVNVLVPNRVYLKIWMNVFNPNIVVKLLMCWATPDNNPENMKRYSLIMDGKAVMNQGDPADAVVITKNCKPGDARFNFMSFVWVPVPPPAQMIFVHCMVKICNTLVPGNNCTTNATAPSGRKRRDVIGGNSDVIEDQHEVVSSGPIIFHQPVSPCKVNNGGCQGYCTVVARRPVCSCPSGSSLNRDGYSCDVDELLYNDNVIIYVMIFILFGVVAFLYKKQQK